MREADFRSLVHEGQIMREISYADGASERLNELCVVAATSARCRLGELIYPFSTVDKFC